MQDSWPGVGGGGSRLSPISLTPYNQELDMKECRRSTSSSPVLLQTAFPDSHYFCWLLIDFFFFCFVIRGWGTDAAVSGFPQDSLAVQGGDGPGERWIPLGNVQWTVSWFCGLDLIDAGCPKFWPSSRSCPPGRVTHWHENTWGWEDSTTTLSMQMSEFYKSVNNFRFNTDNLSTWYNAFIMLYREIYYSFLSVCVCVFVLCVFGHRDGDRL